MRDTEILATSGKQCAAPGLQLLRLVCLTMREFGNAPVDPSRPYIHLGVGMEDGGTMSLFERHHHPL